MLTPAPTTTEPLSSSTVPPIAAAVPPICDAPSALSAPLVFAPKQTPSTSKNKIAQANPIGLQFKCSMIPPFQ